MIKVSTAQIKRLMLDLGGYCTFSLKTPDKTKNVLSGLHLLKAAITTAKENSLTRITLSVRSPNKPAIALYKKFGFAQEGILKNAIFLDGKYEDEYCMGLLLNQA